ncbi:MAG TPA: hypothetical protein VFB25_04190 [Gaiellaceae bacterium]|nr:hypothetical protein [Gaiellaceae bacterium]
MSEIVEIESSPAFEQSELLATLDERGIVARVVTNRRESLEAALVTLSVEGAEIAPRLFAALEDAIERHGRPLVCSPIGALSYSIHAPAA